MTELVSELIITLDGFARGERSPAYYGYGGPQFMNWVATDESAPHRVLMGRKTYEMLNALPDEAKDEGWQTMVNTPGWLVSSTLKTCEWPGLEVINDDLVGRVRQLKQDNGAELRTLGSLSLVHQLLKAGLVDRLKLMVCPLILPKTGVEPTFAGLPDMAFDLVSHKVIDEQCLLLEYRPVGAPPYAS
jgi:dihydrofolate reductase